MIEGSIYNKIVIDMRALMKVHMPTETTILKVLISDIQRDPDKNYSNDNVIGAINKTIKYLNEDPRPEAPKEIEFLKKYLPTQTTKEEIIAYLDTLDKNKLSNVGMVIGMVLKNFPKGTINGNVAGVVVRDYLHS